MTNAVAPYGKVWVCCACGKRSRDKYGSQKIDQGWDESCMMHSRLFDEDDLVMENGRVVRVENSNEEEK